MRHWTAVTDPFPLSVIQIQVKADVKEVSTLERSMRHWTAVTDPFPLSVIQIQVKADVKEVSPLERSMRHWTAANSLLLGEGA